MIASHFSKRDNDQQNHWVQWGLANIFRQTQVALSTCLVKVESQVTRLTIVLQDKMCKITEELHPLQSQVTQVSIVSFGCDMEVRVEVDASLRSIWETCSIYPGSCPR